MGAAKPCIHLGPQVCKGLAEAAAAWDAALAALRRPADAGGAGDGLEGAVHELDDLFQRDLGGVFLQLVAAADAALAAQEAAVAQGEEDLLEKFERDVLLAGEVLDGEVRASRSARHGEQGAQGVFGFFGELHGGQALGREGRGFKMQNGSGGHFAL